MTLKNVANEDLTLHFGNTAGPPDLVYTGDPGIDAVKIVPVLSTHCKALNKKVGTQKITVTWLIATGGCAFTSATHTFVAGGALITPSATKTKADGQIVLREDDSAAAGCVGSWTNNSSGATVPCSCSAKINAAGQAKAKAQ
jgi:hypothetical protein